ncbi:MAG TPA: helix-hairpin-helix domain-containing protein [Clostridia bacterium]|nr:helix-hairpin-helix domain-containing protein [Clostridia bacterium]
MGVKNKQSIILVITIIVIVLVFSISNYIKQQKVYVLSDGTKENIIGDYYNENNMVEQSDGGKIVVHIEGEVEKPGVYELKKDSRVYDAIDAAGGLLKDADRRRINLAKKIIDEEYIYIANKNEEDIEIRYRDNLLIPTGTIENTNLININRANIMELKELPGIGDVLAGRIIEYRNEKGGFKSIEEIKNVSGIGDKKFSDIKDKVTIN